MPCRMSWPHFSQANHDAFDRINLCNIPEASPSLARFPDKLQQHGL